MSENGRSTILPSVDASAETGVLREAALSRLVAIAERDGYDLLRLFGAEGMNSGQREVFRRLYANRLLVFRKATVFNCNVRADGNIRRLFMYASYPSEGCVSIGFYADFSGKFRERAKKLKKFMGTDLALVVKPGDSAGIVAEAAALGCESDASTVEALCRQCGIPIERIEGAHEGGEERIVWRLADELGLEFAPPDGVSCSFTEKRGRTKGGNSE